MRNINFLFGNPLHLFRKVLVMFMLLMIVGVGNVWGGVQKWDLTTNSYSSATGLLVTWSSTGATMTLAQGLGNAPNGYLGNGSDQLHTRFYKSNVLTFTPVSGYTIHKIIITCTSSDYDDGFESSWTNASKSISDGVVTVTPTTGTSACYVTLGNSTSPNRVTQVVVIYTTGAEIVVVDPDFNQLDDGNGYDFGTVTTASGSAILAFYGSCLTSQDNGGQDYIIEAFTSGDDVSSFSINNTDDYFVNSLSGTITLRYGSLSTNKIYTTTIMMYAKIDYPTCGYYDGQTVSLNFPVSVTYNGAPSATASPASWDFGDVAVGGSAYKDFTITTSNLTGNLSVAMYDGSQGMSTTTTVIDQDATSTTVRVTFTPTAAGDYEDLLNISDGGLADDLDIEITGTGVVACQVHWMVNGEDWSENPGEHGNPTIAVISENRVTVLPTPPVAGEDGCGDKFMGWTTSPITGSQGSAPSKQWNSLSCGTCFPAITEETWYYAVFADEQP